MNKIKIAYVGGPVGDPSKRELWGGVASTNYHIKKVFENSEKYELVIRPRHTFFSIEEVRLFLEAHPISWFDETQILQKYFLAGYKRPDVIGPLVRSPLKRYNNGEWIAKYTPEWFYNGKVMRLNEAEEKKSTWLDTYKENKYYKDVDFVSKLDFIRHAIDTDLIKPNYSKKRKYILWAGNQSRPAKNFEMFEKIVKKTNESGGLPEGYEFKVLSNYVIGDYFDILDETALLINTSKYESFCSAIGEAMSKGVPCLVRKDFNGEIMFKERPIQVEYEVNSYVNKIMELLDNKEELETQGKLAREYAVNNFSLDIMREDIEKVFDKIISGKHGK